MGCKTARPDSNNYRKLAGPPIAIRERAADIPISLWCRFFIR